MKVTSSNLVEAHQPHYSRPDRRMNVALIGVGGYGQIYARALLEEGATHNAHLVGAVDANLESPAAAVLRAAGVPLYHTAEQLYRHHGVDLTVISSPIQFHAAQTITALQNKSHVLVEKPVAGTLEEAQTMIAAQKASGLQVAVGFQWSFCPVIQSLKRDIQAGLFGAPTRFRSLVLWPRDDQYYRRNSWAGREYLANGSPVFDSPANNAAAHFLHNMLFCLGRTLNQSATPDSVLAELYRANPIESYDTAVIHVMTEDGVPVQFLTSHAALTNVGPRCSYEFEDAVVTHSENEPFVATFSSGQTKTYGLPVQANSPDKLWNVLADICYGRQPACILETCLPHSQVIALARQSAGSIVTIPPEHRSRAAPLTYIPGMEALMQNCYDLGTLPSDNAQLSWARASQPISLQKSALSVG